MDCRIERRVADYHHCTESRQVRLRLRSDPLLAVCRDDQRSLRINHGSGREGVFNRPRKLPSAHIDCDIVCVGDRQHRFGRCVEEPFCVDVKDREPGLEACGRRLRLGNAGIFGRRIADFPRRVRHAVRVEEMHATRDDVVVPQVIHTLSGHFVAVLVPVKRVLRPAPDRCPGAVVPLHDVKPVVGALGRGNGLGPDPERRIRLGGSGLLEYLVHERPETPEVHPAEARVLPDHVEGAVVPVGAESVAVGGQVGANAVAAVERMALEPVGIGEGAEFGMSCEVVLVVLAPRVVQVVGKRHPGTGSVHIVVDGKIGPHVVRLGRYLRDGEVVEPRGQVELLDDLARKRRVIKPRRIVRVGHLRAGNITAELVKNRKITLVAVLGRLLLDAAGVGLVRERADVLVGVALRIETIPILDQLVREAVRVEGHLVELAIALDTNRVVERNGASSHPEDLERERLADARRVWPFGDKRGLARLDLYAIEWISACERLALVEPKSVRLLVPASRCVAAKVYADVVVVEPSLAVVDAATSVVGDQREVLVGGIDIHL